MDPATLLFLAWWLVSKPADLVPLAVALLAVALLLSSLRRRLQRRAQEPERDSPQREPPRAGLPASKEQLRRDLESLIAELQDLSRKIGAEIDTRFAKLEAVMRDADRRIAVLDRLTRQSAKDKGQSPEAPQDHEARHAVVYELADAGRSPIDIARDLGKTPGEVELILNLRKEAAARSSGEGAKPSAKRRKTDN